MAAKKKPGIVRRAVAALRSEHPSIAVRGFQIATVGDYGKTVYWTGDGWGPRRRAALFSTSLTASKIGAQVFMTGVPIAVVSSRESDVSVSVFLDDPSTKYSRLANVTKPRKRNPANRADSVNASRRRYENFRGETPGSVRPVAVKVPRSALTVGELDGVLYTTTRDGKSESYVHKFRKKSRPLLAASDDGASLHIVGGRYEFTERGIVDK